MIFDTSGGRISYNDVKIYLNNNNCNSTLISEDKKKLLMAVNQNSVVPAIKFLGILIDNKLNFKYHISKISAKIASSMYFIKSAVNLLNDKALKLLYFSLIHCHLIYCKIIWGCASVNTINELFVKQKKLSELSISNHTMPTHNPCFVKRNITTSVINKV
jgi:hypothetical protein